MGLQAMRDESVLRRAAGILGIGYVLVFLFGNFGTGLGNAAFGMHSPAEVVTWAVENESALRLGVFIDLFNDLLSVALVVLWVALSGRGSVLAPLAYIGLGISSAVWMIVLGMLYALPELARLPQGEMLAQGAVVIEWTIESSLRPGVLALALMVVGYLMVRSRSVPLGFGAGLLVLTGAALVGSTAYGTELRDLMPVAGTFGLKLWILVLSIVLLVRPARVARQEARVRASASA